MGLSDIDEDDGPIVVPPPTTSSPAQTVKKALDLDDLFGDTHMSGAQSCAPTSGSTTVTSQKQQQQPVHQKSVVHDVLDDLFSDSLAPASSSTAAGPAVATSNMIYVDSTFSTEPDDSTNLFDFRTATRQSYNDAESFLAGFERQGKKGGVGRVDAKDTLECLTRNKDDNKVKARLLALMNYYDVLGVAPTASEDEIKRRYKKKALELHPDRVGRGQTPEEAELFKVITKANEVLMDRELRSKYDAEIGVGGGAVATGTSSLGNDWLSHLQPQ